MQETKAISLTKETTQTQHHNPKIQHPLIAVWQLDENSKLYCQWVNQNFHK